MMKNNYFRAWDEKEKIMLDGDFIEENYPTYTAGMSYGKLFIANNSDGEWYECIVMQWTGIYDKTGKQIFEGDIVKNGLSGTWIVQPMESGSYSLLGICEKYKDSNFIISALNDHVEIIGNIYEKVESI